MSDVEIDSGWIDMKRHQRAIICFPDGTIDEGDIESMRLKYGPLVDEAQENEQ